MTVSPSTAKGESRVAWKVWPCWLVSESMVSTRRTARAVPVGIVTFCGGGGGGGGAGATGAAGGVVIAAIGAEEVSLLEEDEDDKFRSREARCRVLATGAGDGLVSSTGGAGEGVAACAVSAGGAATCRLLITCFTPGSAAA